MEKLLREYIRESLKEAMEIVTIARDNEHFAYQVEFDAKGNILASTPISRNSIPSDEAEMIKIAAKYSAVPFGTVLRKIRNLKEAGLEGQALQATASSHADVVKVLNNHWKDTLNWNPVHGKGKGEVQLHLAFKAKENVKEPDFVSEDGNVSFSVKYVGTGSEAARTGESSASKKYTKNLSIELARILDFSLDAYQKNFSGSTLLLMHSNGLLFFPNQSSESKLEAINEALSTIEATKQAIFDEYPNMKILMCDDSVGFYLVERTNELRIRTIKNLGTRLEISGPMTSEGRMDLEKALENIKISIRNEGGGSSARGERQPSG